jgi:hypothetical protein
MPLPSGSDPTVVGRSVDANRQALGRPSARAALLRAAAGLCENTILKLHACSSAFSWCGTTDGFSAISEPEPLHGPAVKGDGSPAIGIPRATGGVP